MPNNICITLAHGGGDGPITFVVTDPRDLIDTVVVLDPGDPPTEVCLNDWPCGEYVIPVTANDAPFDQDVTVDCRGALTVGSAVSCDTEGNAIVTITLSTVGCPASARIYNPATATSQIVNVAADDQEVRILSLPCGQWRVEVYECPNSFDETLIASIPAECECPEPVASCSVELVIYGLST